MKISPKKYAQALAETLEGKEDSREIIHNFLLLLRRKKQSRLLSKILQAFEAEWASRKGIVKLRVAYPEKFGAGIKAFEEGVSQILGKSVEIEKKPMASMLGGLRVQVGDTLIDASLEGRLKALSHRLSN